MSSVDGALVRMRNPYLGAQKWGLLADIFAYAANLFTARSDG
jgi:hypothetical protein